MNAADYQPTAAAADDVTTVPAPDYSKSWEPAARRFRDLTPEEKERLA